VLLNDKVMSLDPLSDEDHPVGPRAVAMASETLQRSRAKGAFASDASYPGVLNASESGNPAQGGQLHARATVLTAAEPRQPADQPGWKTQRGPPGPYD